MYDKNGKFIGLKKIDIFSYNQLSVAKTLGLVFELNYKRRIFMSKDYIERNTYSELLELDLQEVVSENIKRCVAESGFTAEQLSYRTNLSVATINRLKAGQNLSIRGICALADALNKDWRVFFA